MYRFAILSLLLAACPEPTDVDRKFIISYYIRSALKRSVFDICARHFLC